MSLKENIEQGLAKAGRIGRHGWGEKIAIGILIGHLESVTPQKVWEYISANKNLFDNVSDEEWEYFKNQAEWMNLSEIDTARFRLELNKRRNDLFQIIANTSGGLEWLDYQVGRFREKLGLLTES